MSRLILVTGHPWEVHTCAQHCPLMPLLGDNLLLPFTTEYIGRGLGLQNGLQAGLLELLVQVKPCPLL